MKHQTDSVKVRRGMLRSVDSRGMAPVGATLGVLFALIPLACVSTRPPLLDPCAFHGPPSPDDAILESDVALMLLDGRPLVVPRGRRSEVGRNLAGHRLPPGHHTLHTSYQVSGFSPYVAVSYAHHFLSHLRFCFLAEVDGRGKLHSGRVLHSSPAIFSFHMFVVLCELRPRTHISE